MLQINRGEKTRPAPQAPRSHPYDAATIVGPEHAADSAGEHASGWLANEQLLFGIVSLQSGFVSREQLVAGIGTWAREQSRTLPEILENQGALSPADRRRGEQLTADFIATRGADAQQSLGALAALSTLRADMARLGDAELSVSLSHDELLKLLGDNLLRLGKRLQESGVTDFALASTYDQTGELLLKLGHGAEALHQFDIGRQLVEQSARARPDDDVARANLALDASFPGDLADIYGSYGDAQLRLGMMPQARDSYAKSRDYFGQMTQHSGENVSLLSMRAQIYDREALVAAQDNDAVKAAENYELARKVRDQLAEIDPGNMSWLAARALTLACCGRCAEAKDQAAALVQRAPGSSPAQLQRARCLAMCAQHTADREEKGQFVSQALEAVAAAIESDFSDPAVLVTDPYLAILQPEPAFQSSLEKLKR